MASKNTNDFKQANKEITEKQINPAKYTKLNKIGHGAHGYIYKCRLNDSSLDLKPEFVAVKKMKSSVKFSNEGLSSQTIRELMYMQELHHPNILNLRDVYRQKKDIYLVFDFVPFNLETIIHSEKFTLTDANVKSFMRMLLKGIAFCHKNWILHRDLKPSNCLISEKGILKIADFGLAKSFGDKYQKMSPEACTLWYRAPELLFGAKYYGPAMDMWSIGCIFGEMLLRKTLFAGNRTEISQLSSIFALLGTPNDKNWPNVKKLPNFFEFEKTEPQNLEEIFVSISPDALNLFRSLCQLDPNRRISAKEALNSDYFQSFPVEQNFQFEAIF